MLFFVARGDVASFSPAVHFDPEYARLLREARDAGVRLLALKFSVRALVALRWVKENAPHTQTKTNTRRCVPTLASPWRGRFLWCFLREMQSAHHDCA